MREIDWDTMEIDGIDLNDAPDFSDAYFTFGKYKDGTNISEQELEELSTSDVKYQAIDRLFY